MMRSFPILFITMPVWLVTCMWLSQAMKQTCSLKFHDCQPSDRAIWKKRLILPNIKQDIGNKNSLHSCTPVLQVDFKPPQTEVMMIYKTQTSCTTIYIIYIYKLYIYIFNITSNICMRMDRPPIASHLMIPHMLPWNLRHLSKNGWFSWMIKNHFTIGKWLQITKDPFTVKISNQVLWKSTKWVLMGYTVDGRNP